MLRSPTRLAASGPQPRDRLPPSDPAVVQDGAEIMDQLFPRRDGDA